MQEGANQTPAEILADHATRPIRAFLDRSHGAEEALWEAVYGNRTVDHSTAVRVARELTQSPRPVQDVLDGWRPDALTQGSTR